jgi:hypothetical protein
MRDVSVKEYHLNSGIGTARPLQNSSYSTPIVPEIPVIGAQNNRGFLLPVTVVVILPDP